MTHRTDQPKAASFRVGRMVWITMIIAAALSSCKSPPESRDEKIPLSLIQQLSGARIDTANTKLQQGQPAEALALLVSALKTDSTSEEARRLTGKILAETIWHIPETTLDHQSPIDQIAFTPPSSLWISQAGKINTTARWNLETSKIESVLFPVHDSSTRSLTFDARHQITVIQRGSVTLLCDAVTLKPIRTIDNPPDSLTPSAVIVFSKDGLLMAHPAFVSESDRSMVWKLRDSASGEIIRISEPVKPDAAQPIAAFLDRIKLRVIHSDGSLMEIPVSPVEASETTPLPEPATLLHAQFSANGGSVMALLDQGPHEPPARSVIAYNDEDDGSLETDVLMKRFPWSRHPNLWTGLMNTPEPLSFKVDGPSVKFPINSHAPLKTDSAITALAFTETHILTGEEHGRVTLHRLLPAPRKIADTVTPPQMNPAFIKSLENLAVALTGTRYDEASRKFLTFSTADRIAAFQRCDMPSLRSLFRQLDFTHLEKAFQAYQSKSVDAATDPVFQGRLARADANAPSALKEAARLSEIFQSDDNPKILKAIQDSGGHGAAAAISLALALQSNETGWIKACLSSAQDLPPLLRRMANSRIAWLEGRKADALSGWPEVIPDLAQTRHREDWDGWEQADFEPALQDIRRWVTDELAAIAVPANSTPEQRKQIAERLKNPATLAAVGRARFADACLKAALAFSAHKQEIKTTFQLAKLARDLGAPPAPCLRAEALALTAMGDHKRSHPRWIELITEHPVETHLSGDYAEAAYTAYENANPRQAMEILTTGMHRFPRDGNFALRAGWVALLTGNSQRAYQFLLEGKRIGFPPGKQENATALLTIAAEQVGATDDATVYFRDLLEIDPAWSNASILDTLEWPEELKTILRQFMH